MRTRAAAPGAGRRGADGRLDSRSRIMLHQPSGGAQGMASDIAIRAQEILTLRTNLNNIYSKHTGVETAVIEEKLDRDHFMSAEEARAFGIVDEVILERSSDTANAR